MDQTPNLQLPYIAAAQAQKHVTHNDAIRMLDALLQIGVASRSVTAPPASPANGVRYIVPAGATGAWATATGRFAAFQDGAWTFFTPQEGFIAWIADEHTAVVNTAGAWSPLMGSLTQLGINATADPTNRLAVASAASLFNNAGSGHQLKVNKANPAATASVLYQTGFSGRAEIGTTGDDNVHIKVSPDGSAWFEAVNIASTTGRASFPQGGVVTSTQVSVTVAVPAGAATIQAALDMLQDFHFEGSAQGIVSVANGTYALTAPLTCRHPQPSRIVLRAASAATLPVDTDFTGVKATDQAMIQSKFKVIVTSANVGAVSATDAEGLGLIQDVAFVCTGLTGSPAGITAVRRAGVVLDRCAVFGFTNNVYSREQGQITCTNCSLAYSAAANAAVQLGGFLRAAATLVLYSGANGIDISHSEFTSDSALRVKGSAATGVALSVASRGLISGGNVSGNTGPGVTLTAACALEIVASTISGGAAQVALLASDGSTALLTTLTAVGDATQRAFTAQRGSILSTTGTQTGPPVFSPALGTTANSGAWAF